MDAAVTEEDTNWAYSHYSAFNGMASESDSFRFSLEAAIDWRYAKDPRAATARIWAGIESFLGFTSELSFRISLTCASLLAPRGDQRKAKYNEVKKLYIPRSKAVHGQRIKDEEMKMVMTESYVLLRSLLLLSIEKGRMLGQVDFEDAVFC